MLSSLKLDKAATRQRSNSTGHLGISDGFFGTGNLILALDDVKIHDTLLTCCPPCSENGKQKLLLDSWTLAMKTKPIARPQYDLKGLSPVIPSFGLKTKDIITSPRDALASEQPLGSKISLK